jgi:hypothetical protein
MSVIPQRQVPYRYKQPDEVRKATFNFGAKAGAGVELSGAPTLVVPAGISASPPTVDGMRVTVLVSGGTLGQIYRISCRHAVTSGEVLELDVDIGVEDAN